MSVETKNQLVKSETASELMLKAAAETDTMGRLLKFTKGHYYVGDDESTAGREMIAHVTQWARGWVKWADGKPVSSCRP